MDSRPRSENRSNATLVQERLLVIACANIPLLFVAWFGTSLTYKSPVTGIATHSLQAFTGIIVVGLILQTENLANRLISGLNLPPRPARARGRVNDETTEATSAPIEPTAKASLIVYFAFLVLIIAVDFVATGRLVTATGGLMASPFAQIPLIMIVIGGVMSRSRPPFRIIFIVLGIIYFYLCQYTGAFGHPVQNPQIAHANRVPILLLVVTAMNLIISISIQIFQTPHKSK